MRLLEFAPLTLAGSFHRSLIFNKLWLISELSRFKDRFSTIYVLGSWYGNMSLLLARSNIQYDQIINVDRDARVVRAGQSIAEKMGLADGIRAIAGDANQVDFGDLDSNSLVINTSCYEIKNTGWFDRIPAGTMIALETRTDVDEDLADYELSNVLYQGSRELTDPETDYVSILKIGIK